MSTATDNLHDLRTLLLFACQAIMEECAAYPGSPDDLLDYDWIQVPYARGVAAMDRTCIGQLPGARGRLHLTDTYNVEHTMDWRVAWDQGVRRAVLCIGPAQLDDREVWR